MTDQLDKLAVLRAEIDQMVTSMPELARAYYGYYQSLRDAGFTDDQAFQLTRDYMRGLLQTGGEQ